MPGETGGFGGVCFGANVYRPEYATRFPPWRWRDAMQWQIIIYMAGGVAEAIHRGEWLQQYIFWFAMQCGAGGDREAAEAIIADLRKLTGRRHGLERFAIRARKLLLANWPAVEAIAAVLIRDRRIDGAEIEALLYSEDIQEMVDE